MHRRRRCPTAGAAADRANVANSPVLMDPSRQVKVADLAREARYTWDGGDRRGAVHAGGGDERTVCVIRAGGRAGAAADRANVANSHFLIEPSRQIKVADLAREARDTWDGGDRRGAIHADGGDERAVEIVAAALQLARERISSNGQQAANHAYGAHS